MPPRGQTAAARNPRTSRAQRPRPRGGESLPRVRVGWDRRFKLVLIAAVGLICFIALKAGVALLAARAQAAQETRLLSSLERQHSALVAQEKSLHQRATIVRDARRLGMVAAGERPFVVVNLGH